MRKLKLLFTGLAFLGGVFSANAQTDVTSTYLTNADFSETTPITGTYLYGYGKDGSPYGYQTVDGWTSVVTSGDNSNASYPNSGTAAAVFSYGSSTQLKGNSTAAPATNPDGEASGNCFGFFGVWGCGGYYYQNVTLAAGKYTITVPMYSQSGTQANTTYTGFFPTSGTNRTVAVNPTVGEWANQSVTFTLTDDTEGQIRIGYQSTGGGSGANPMLFIDCVKIEFTAIVVKDVLETAITNATKVNIDLEGALDDAIATAQAVYDNENATQEQVNAAAETLNNAVNQAMATASNINVTDLFLTNANLSSTDGWTAYASGTSGTNYQDYSNGLIGTYNVRFSPATVDDTHLATEYCFGFECRWSGNYASYNQTTKPVPAGVYTLTFDVENVNGSTTSANYNNLFYLEAGSNKVTDTATEWMQGGSSWTTHTIRITLEEATPLKVSFGYGTGSNNIGAANTPALYVSHIKLNYSGLLAGAKAEWQEAWNALDALDETALPDAAEAAITDALGAAEPTTVDGYNTATAVLQALVDSYDGIKAAYDEYKTIKAQVEDLKNTSKYTFTGDDALSTFTTALSDIDDDVEAATDAATLTALVSTLKAAGNTFVGAIESTDGFDLTYNVVNNSFETGSLSPWTTNGSGDTGVKENSVSNYTTTGVDGDYLFNTWNNNAGSKVSQTIADLPEGYYTVTALVASDAGNTINIIAGATTKAIDSDATDGKTVFVEGTTDKTLVSDGSLEIGANSATWYKADNFRLTYYTLTAGAAQAWAAAKAAAEAARDNDDYVNVAGSEKATLLAEIAKAEPTTAEAYGTATTALQEATTAFVNAKDSYDAYAAALAATSGLVEADILEVPIADNDEATAADAAKAALILPKAEASKGGTAMSPYSTDWVINGTFDSSDISMWSCNNSFQNKGRKTTDDSNAGNMNASKPWWENWNGSSLVNKMYQTIENIPNGTYRLDITAFVNNFDAETESQYVFANNNQTPLTEDAKSGANYEVYTVVTNNTIEVGFEQTTATANWMGIDNVSLRYYGVGDVVNDAKNAGHKLAWLEAKDAAEAARDNSDYENVLGSEKVALLAEIAKAEPTTAEGYDEAAAALTSATQTFVNAKTNYDIFATYNTTLAYADPAKKPSIDEETTAASIIPALRAYYESHALAEGVEGAENVTSCIANATDPTNNDGWTWTGSKNNPASNEPWTDADGNNTHSYFDGGNWNGSNWTTTMKQTISLPVGKYLLTAKGRAATNTTLTMAVGEANVELPHVSSTGNVFDRGWGDGSVEFTTDGNDVEIVVTATAEPTHEWFSISDFRLMRLELNTDAYAGATEYAALNDAIETAEDNTLGFEDGQYAPYNNVEALEALAAAKAIDQTAELTNLKADVEAVTEALADATWTANDGDVAIVYNGTFAETGVGDNPKGWTRSNNGWGQQITGLTAEANGVDDGTTTAWYYNNNGAWEYGKDNIYKMPLAADTKYVLSFKYSKHGSDSQSWMKASVVNDSEEGLDVVQFPGAESNTTYKSAKAYFTTGAAGNYILRIEQNGNAHLTDVSIEKASSTTMDISENSTTIPELAFYETVSLTRTIKANDTWNTFVVPFDIDNDELKAKFGDDVAVAEYSEEADGENSTVSFDKMDTPAITANKPVLLKTSTAGTSYEFTGKLIKTGEAKVEGINFDFVGTYDATFTIPELDYFISDNKLWRAEENKTTIKGTRAYIHDMNPGNARIVNFFIDGQETTGISTIATQKFDNATYDMQGRRVETLKKGIYVVNGKKVVVK